MNIWVLKQLEKSPRTQHHSKMFQNWLTSTASIKTGNAWIDKLQPGNDQLAGPLRFDVIKRMGNLLSQQFVVMKYEKRGYQKEHGEVAVFNNSGELVAYYLLDSRTVYESQVLKPGRLSMLASMSVGLLLLPCHKLE